MTVTFDVRGREYNGRYFNNLQGWEVPSPENQSHDAPAPEFTAPPVGSDFANEDIPY